KRLPPSPRALDLQRRIFEGLALHSMKWKWLSREASTPDGWVALITNDLCMATSERNVAFTWAKSLKYAKQLSLSCLKALSSPAMAWSSTPDNPKRRKRAAEFMR